MALTGPFVSTKPCSTCPNPGVVVGDAVTVGELVLVGDTENESVPVGLTE